jgi:hypothetical protein
MFEENQYTGQDSRANYEIDVEEDPSMMNFN